MVFEVFVGHKLTTKCVKGSRVTQRFILNIFTVSIDASQWIQHVIARCMAFPCEHILLFI